MNPQINRIILGIAGKEVSLTVEEAKALHAELEKLFAERGRVFLREYVPFYNPPNLTFLGTKTEAAIPTIFASSPGGVGFGSSVYFNRS